MFGFAAMIYTTMYMRLINLRNRTQEKWSFYHMNIQYQRMLSFMNEDGSFSLFRSDWFVASFCIMKQQTHSKLKFEIFISRCRNMAPKSVWLTSYCIRIFQEARFYEWENYLYIDPEVSFSFAYTVELERYRCKKFISVSDHYKILDMAIETSD